MYVAPLTSLNWAYQLHYYLCFRTHRRRPTLATCSDDLFAVMREVCDRHDFHLLECQPHDDHLRCLLSLQPSQQLAKVVQTIKANTSRELAMAKPLWARGYLARSIGRVRISVVRRYLDQQAKHHGYDSRVLPPVYRFRSKQPRELKSAHASFDLSHHVVLGTYGRKGLFTSTLGAKLCDYWLRVADLRGFTIDQATLVPDHIHLIVRIVPTMSIEDCVLMLLNNGHHFLKTNYPRLLLSTGVEGVWTPSAYAGTCGNVTTALQKAWLQ